MSNKEQSAKMEQWKASIPDDQAVIKISPDPYMWDGCIKVISFDPAEDAAPLPVSEREREEQPTQEELWGMVDKASASWEFYEDGNFRPDTFVQWMRDTFTLTRKQP